MQKNNTTKNDFFVTVAGTLVKVPEGTSLFTFLHDIRFAER